jgi:hypothetical protein
VPRLPHKRQGRLLTVLLTNITLSGRTGTEIQTRNIALALARRGHKSIVYSPELGEIAFELRSAGIPVIDDILLLQQAVDVIHGHHLPVTATAIAALPDSPAIFICHDFVSWHDTPPGLPAIYRYLAVDRPTFDRLTIESGVPMSRAAVLLNEPDIDRYKLGPPLPPKPRRALAVVKHGDYLNTIATACRLRGMSLEAVGAGVGKPIPAPEVLLPNYDLVFTSALTAMEAIACGRAVIVCDSRGLAGLVTSDRFATWRPLNFGLRCLTQPLDPEAIGREIDDYDATDALAVCNTIRGQGGLEAYVETLVRVYEEVIEEHQAAPPANIAVSKAFAGYLQRWSPRVHPGWPWMRERQELLDRILDLSLGIEISPFEAPLGFDSSERRRWWRALVGFSERESWGTWTDGDHASFCLQIDASASSDVEIAINLRPFVPTSEVMASVVANGISVAAWRFRPEQHTRTHAVVCCVPADVVAKDGLLWIAFHIKGASSPREAGIGPDDRRLGLGFQSLVLRRGNLRTGPTQDSVGGGRTENSPAPRD